MAKAATSPGGMKTHHRLHIPNSLPGQKLPLLGKLIKLNRENAFPWSSSGPGSTWGFKVEPTLGELQGFQLRSLQPDRDGDEHTDFSSKVAGKATSGPTAKARGSRRDTLFWVQGERTRGLPTTRGEAG